MRGSYRLGTAFGIGVFVHWSFAILVGYVLFTTLSAGAGWVIAFNSVVFVLAVFGCILLHELGHSLAARRYGIGTHDITLLPIGGVARLERIPEEPKQELVIAVAGPAVNVVIAAVLSLVAVVFRIPAPQTAMAMFSDAAIIHGLIYTNIVLVIFNMLPAFPMDGGRVLRAFLAMRHGMLPATETAVKVGKVMALIMALSVFYHGNIFIFFIAGFVFIAGAAELQAVRMRHTAPGDQLREMMQRMMGAFGGAGGEGGEGGVPPGPPEAGGGSEPRPVSGRVVED